MSAAGGCFTLTHRGHPEQALQNNRDIDLGLAMSGSFLATIPLLVLFVFVGRRLVQGIMEGAFKG